MSDDLMGESNTGAYGLFTADGLTSESYAVSSATRELLKRLAANRLAVLGLGMLGVVVVLAVFAPVIAPQGPFHIDISAISQAPSSHHLLGTDDDGRDVWARVVYGSRTSLAVGFGAVGLALVIGSGLGLLAGLTGSWISALIMRITDAFMSVPAILLIMLFVSVVGPSLSAIIVSIALTTWTHSARLVRGQVLSLREREFVLSSYVMGVPRRRVVGDHILPHLFGPLTVLATFDVANAILIEAGLSFLGVGVRPPTPSWGQMVSAAESPIVLLDQPWMWVPAAIAIVVTVLAVNFVGEGMRDAVDPRSRK